MPSNQLADARRIEIINEATQAWGRKDNDLLYLEVCKAVERELAASPIEQPAAAPIEYRYEGGTHWCDLGPAERMRPDFKGVYRLKSGTFPVWAGDPAPSPADERAETRALPMMRSAFRVTEVSGDPDPAKQSFAMRFSFPSIEALHAADDEWRKFATPSPADERAATPAAKWRVNGEADPLGTQYDCERAALTLGTLTDDALANAVFVHDHRSLNVEAVLRGEPSSIALLTAAKERIRWLSRALEHARAASSNETGAEVSGECFIVIGHGETDIPEAKIVTHRKDLLDAVLGMMYWPASDAPDDVRAEYAAALADEDEWAADTWSVSFEIGGIVVWRVGLHPFALPRSPAMAAEAVSIPAGWKAMPPSATTAMRMAMAKAAADYMQRTGGNSPDAIYEAGFAAAPQPAQAHPNLLLEQAACALESMGMKEMARIVRGDKIPNDGSTITQPSQAAMPVLTDAMRAVITNESGAYQSADDLYAALCAAAGVERPAQADARVGLTDDLRAELEWCAAEGNCGPRTRSAIHRVLAAHPGQPEPRAKVTLTEAQIDAIADEGRRNAAGGIYAGSVYDFAYACIDAARAGGQHADQT